MNTPMASTAPATSSANPACLVLRTGHAGCEARFYPARYQLVLERAGHEEKIELGFSGSRLLERLLLTPGEVVSREELMSFAWSDRVVGQGSLNQQIYTLRQVLGDEKNREIIQTLPRRGYMLNPHFLDLPPAPEEAPGDALLPTLVAPEVLPAPTATPQRLVQVLPMLAIGLALGIGLLALVAYQRLAGPQMHSSAMHLGNAVITRVAQDEGLLRQLTSSTRELGTRMAELAQRPVELLITRNADFYQVLCLPPEGSARWLMAHESQLAVIGDADIRRCLP
ncbi:hypothetical protein D9M68_119220 [compost metagenome]